MSDTPKTRPPLHSKYDHLDTPESVAADMAVMESLINQIEQQIAQRREQKLPAQAKN